jgi:hypothetical protein
MYGMWLVATEWCTESRWLSMTYVWNVPTSTMPFVTHRESETFHTSLMDSERDSVHHSATTSDIGMWLVATEWCTESRWLSMTYVWNVRDSRWVTYWMLLLVCEWRMTCRCLSVSDVWHVAGSRWVTYHSVRPSSRTSDIPIRHSSTASNIPYVTHRQPACPKYIGSSKLLFQAYYCVQHVIVSSNLLCQVKYCVHTCF